MSGLAGRRRHRRGKARPTSTRRVIRRR
jgi:hypothetical protein